MNNQQINKAIAESIGWDFRHVKVHGWGTRGVWAKPLEGKMVFRHSIPDYCNDLNALRDVVLGDMLRAGGTWTKYLDHLRVVCKIQHEQVRLALVEASAAQRAEAYLKTIGKWQPETSRKLGARKPCPVTLIMDDEGAITELDNNSSREDGAN